MKKLTKREIKKIIREEKTRLVPPSWEYDYGSNSERQKLVEQAGGMSYRAQEELASLAYRFGEEINGLMGQYDRNWYENPEFMNAIQSMLDDLKQQFSQFTTN